MAEYEILPTRPIIPFEPYLENTFLIKNNRTNELMVFFRPRDGVFYRDLGMSSNSWVAVPLDYLYPKFTVEGQEIPLRNSIDNRLWGCVNDTWFPAEEYNNIPQILYDLNNHFFYFWYGVIGSIPIKSTVTNPYDESETSLFNIECYSNYAGRDINVYKEPYSLTLEHWSDPEKVLEVKGELMGYYSRTSDSGSSRLGRFPFGSYTGQGALSGKSFSISDSGKKGQKFLSNAAMFKWETTYELF